MKHDFISIPHTADIQIRVFGKTIQELFVNALYGMFQVIEPRTDECEVKDGRLVCKELPIKREIEVIAPDKEALLVDFLSEALYLSDVHNEAYFDADFTEFSDDALNGTIKGVLIHGFNVEIKAVTYHGMKIEQVDGVWQTDIVFDV